MPKTSELTQLTAMTADDEILGINDVDGTPGTRRYTADAVARQMLQSAGNGSLYIATQEGVTGDGTTDDTAAIQTMLDAIDSNGGGVAFFPEGIYGVTGNGTASAGALRVKDNTSIIGAGIGATTFKLLNAQAGNDLTGIIRTPTGVQNRNIYMADFSIDGNVANVTDRIIGLYLGVTPSEAITVSVSGTTATATMVSGTHGLTTSDTIYIFNGDNPGLTGDFTITVSSTTVFTFTVASGTPSDATGYTWFFDVPFAEIADEDIVIERVEVKDCNDYGFDPHERVRRLTLRDCIAHGNGALGDGFTLDGVFDSLVIGCSSYNNARNGFNLVTGSSNNRVINCHAWGNTQYGFASQRGSTIINRNTNNIFANCASWNNQHGFRLQMCRNHHILGCHAYENNQHGIRLEGNDHCIVEGNSAYNNGQTANDTYDEIRIEDYAFAADSTDYDSVYNLVANNNCHASLTNKAKYSIHEVPTNVDNNAFLNNIVTGAVTKNFLLSGESSHWLSVPTENVFVPSVVSGMSYNDRGSTHHRVSRFEFTAVDIPVTYDAAGGYGTLQVGTFPRILVTRPGAVLVLTSVSGSAEISATAAFRLGVGTNDQETANAGAMESSADNFIGASADNVTLSGGTASNIVITGNLSSGTVNGYSSLRDLFLNIAGMEHTGTSNGTITITGYLEVQWFAIGDPV